MAIPVSFRRWVASFALVGIGFLVSLLPSSEYAIASTGVPHATLIPVWPGHGVRQQLGNIDSPIRAAEIWTAAYKDGEPVHVEVSIVRNGSQTIRQFSTRAEAAVKPQLKILHFEPYETSPTDKFELEVAVGPNQASFVMLGIAKSETPFAQVTVNGEALDFQGPLAYKLTGERNGFRAALSGAPAESVRLHAGLASLALSIGVALLGPAVSSALRRLARRLPSGATDVDRRRRYFYPWLIALYPILYFYSNNVFVFSLIDFLLTVLVASALVTVMVVILRLAMRASPESAALTAAIGSSVFLTYGYVERAFGENGDARVLLPILVVLTIVLILWVWPRREFAAKVGRFLNPASAVLLLVPILANVGSLVPLFAGQGERDEIHASFAPSLLPDLEKATLHPAIAEPNKLPDIYYIILDAYTRADVMQSHDNFDNSAFLDALASRGFYVPPGAIANYRTTPLALPSSFNLTWVEELGDAAQSWGIRRFLKDHVIGTTLQALGYTYVHLNSGFEYTNNVPTADMAVEFTPEGPTIVEPRTTTGLSALLSRQRATRHFVRELLNQTTMLRPLLPPLPVTRKASYEWSVPQRTLATFAYLETIPSIPEPTFTISHILKPHGPWVFDQFGNTTYPLFWEDDHDPTVPSAYYGQVLYLNKLVIQLIDKIIANSESPPIVIITADHGSHSRTTGLDKHKIFAAYYLPHGGNNLLYPSISSVNNFRVVLDYYFGLNLGLLDDTIHNRTE